MNCPYCGKEMEEGLIQSLHEITWKKGVKRRLFGGSLLHPDAVTLSEFSLIGSGVVAHLCRECGKMVIDLADETSDLNNR